MVKKIILLVLISLPFWFLACEKEKSAKAPTKTEILSSQPWKFDKATVAGQDIGSQIPACYQDNLFTLKADKTGIIDESINVCTPSSAGTFTWRFSTNEDSLILSVPLVAGFSGSFKIDSISATVLKLSQTVNVPPINLPAPAVLQLKR
jgi:hypothetical protein